MKPNTTRVSTRFGKRTYFQVRPVRGKPGAAEAQNSFEQLKARLLKPILHEAFEPGVRHQLQLAANEAAAVAWTTPFPLLVLPVLFEEKTAGVFAYNRRSQVVQRAPGTLVEVEATA